LPPNDAAGPGRPGSSASRDGRFAAWLKARRQRLRYLTGRAGLLNVLAVSAYLLIILFLLVVSVGYDEEANGWRLGPIAAETIVLALLLFLPFLLPRISSLSFPFLTGQASIEFRSLRERIERQEEKVAILSNETDLLIGSLAAHLLAPEARERAGEELIVIGCQRGSEQKVLGALLKRLVQARTGLPEEHVVTRFDQGGGALNFVSLHRGKIDLCPAYTWQGYELSLGPSLQFSTDLRAYDVDAAIADLNAKYEGSNIRWLDYLGFSSNWELVMVADAADAAGVKTADDLPVRSPQMVLGCPREFFARDAAYGTMEREGCRFAKVRFLEGVALYDSLMEGEVDLAVGFSTDARLESLAVTTLDSGDWFGDYYAVPIVHRQALSDHPELADAVAGLAAALGGQDAALPEMRRLVREAEGMGASPEGVEIVAHRFLRAKGLV
jgi:osmoprotectant transport system substrate-binding protein